MSDKKRGFNRRNFLGDILRGGAALAGATLAFPVAGWARSDALRFASDPFSLGVASGDPWADSVVLWTRLAPDALNGGGMPERTVPVKWEVATDERMQKVVASGTAMARPALGHSVQVAPDAIEYLVRVGCHRLLGARPMRGMVERGLQDAVASSLLTGRSGSGLLRVNSSSSALTIDEAHPSDEQLPRVTN